MQGTLIASLLALVDNRHYGWDGLAGVESRSRGCGGCQGAAAGEKGEGSRAAERSGAEQGHKTKGKAKRINGGRFEAAIEKGRDR